MSDLAARLTACVPEVARGEANIMKARLLQDAAAELARLTAENARLREAAASMLAAMIEDFGDPNEFPTDDGAVAAGVDSQSFITFKMMRDWRAALETPNDPE